MLAKKYRLNLREIRIRPIAGSPHFSWQTEENKLGFNRFGVAIGRKLLPKAVSRNRWRRRIFSWLEKQIFSGSRDWVIVLKKKPTEEDREKIRLELENVLHL